ncbi:MAG: HAD family phosphatase [Ruminiclostridium sp.]|nr:HAD family phosphatase [Ruminiclostridium sp.]
MSIDLISPDFKAAVFDLDGTLFDSMTFWSELDARFLKRRGVDPVPEDYLLAIAHLGAVETANYTIERFGLDETPEALMTEWHNDAVRFYSEEVSLKAGAAQYLRFLKGKGVELAVATASNREIYMPALERCGIKELFSAFAEVGECARRKGFPDVYELACSRMGASVAETVVFEDIYIAVKGAKAGGFRTVGVYDATSARDTELIKAASDGYITAFTELCGQS